MWINLLSERGGYSLTFSSVARTIALAETCRNLRCQLGRNLCCQLTMAAPPMIMLSSVPAQQQTLTAPMAQASMMQPMPMVPVVVMHPDSGNLRPKKQVRLHMYDLQKPPYVDSAAALHQFPPTPVYFAADGVGTPVPVSDCSSSHHSCMTVPSTPDILRGSSI